MGLWRVNMVATSASINKKSIITLYSGSLDLESHKTRIVLNEKNVYSNVIEVEKDSFIRENLKKINPYNLLPTFVDRDLVLYNSDIIVEYLDERFPHPPLLPVYPIVRAKFRLLIHRIEEDWGNLYKKLVSKEFKNKHILAKKIRNELKTNIINMSSLFSRRTDYFLSDDFSLLDCCISPILWRLPSINIEFSRNEYPEIVEYLEHVFERDSFYKSLTDAECEIRDIVKY